VGGITAVAKLPDWVTLLRAPNPGPMTLDGTNTWILRAPGQEYGVVIDPGPLDEGHLARIAEHGPFLFILITHGHHDHVEGAARLSELLGGVPVLAADAKHVLHGHALRIRCVFSSNPGTTVRCSPEIPSWAAVRPWSPGRTATWVTI
jgi:glyoxylase-like metal-dependent hydrolase (beta-lactamase superfamily II)